MKEETQRKSIQVSTGEYHIAEEGGENVVPTSLKTQKKITKSLEHVLKSKKDRTLESDTVKIDAKKDKDRKLENGRKEVPSTMYYHPNGEHMEHRVFTMLMKELGKNANVVEYIDNNIADDAAKKNGYYFDKGAMFRSPEMTNIEVRHDREVPHMCIGKQKFTYEAAKKLNLLKRMPRDINEFAKAFAKSFSRISTRRDFALAGYVNTKEHTAALVDEGEIFLLGNGKGVMRDGTNLHGCNVPATVAASVLLFNESEDASYSQPINITENPEERNWFDYNNQTNKEIEEISKDPGKRNAGHFLEACGFTMDQLDAMCKKASGLANKIDRRHNNHSSFKTIMTLENPDFIEKYRPVFVKVWLNKQDQFTGKDKKILKDLGISHFFKFDVASGYHEKKLES